MHTCSPLDLTPTDAEGFHDPGDTLPHVGTKQLVL